MSKRSSSPEPSRTLAILGYHKIGDPPPGGWRSWFYVPEEVFVSQLEYLRDSEWAVIGARTFLRGLAEPESLPKRSALLTFDDGYRSMLTMAAPILLGFGYPSILFVPTGFIGKTNAFEQGAEPEENICDWKDLRELERNGVSVQSHSVSHRSFSALELREQREELANSKAALEDGLKKPVELFAYPYGDAGTDRESAGEAARRAGYRAAFLYKGGKVGNPAQAPYRLPRLAMGPDTNLRKKLAST